jgi:uncharacterized protein YggU (UPF0235/DUF167 family)
METAADGRQRLKLRVRAVPEAGAANRAAAIVIAKWLGVPKSAVTLTAGDTSRAKTFFVALPVERVAEAIEALATTTR